MDETTAPEGHIWVLLSCDNLSYEYGEYFCAVGQTIAGLQTYVDENWMDGMKLSVTKQDDKTYVWHLANNERQPEYRAELHEIR